MKLGPNFAIAPKEIPVEDIVIETERVAKRFEKQAFQVHRNAEEGGRNMTRPERNQFNQKMDSAREMRKKVQTVINKEKNRKMTPNLTNSEIRGMKKVEKDKDRVYIQADKGHVMVAMWKLEEKGENSYNSKVKKLLEDQNAVLLMRGGRFYDPTKNLEDKANRIIQGIVRRGEMEKDEAESLLRLKDSHAPRLTGLPKIHKPVTNYPLRPVVSCLNSPFSKISKHLTSIFQGYLGRSGVTVKNSLALRRKAEAWVINEETFLVSFDVKSLYPQVPIPEAIALLGRLVDEDQNLDRKTKLSPASVKELLQFCLSNSYFEVDQKWYKINCGMIGLDLMGVTADLYMENHEMKAIEESPEPPTDQARYVDDYIAKMEGEASAENYLEHLNSLEEPIQFTMEKEEAGKIAVLDLEMEKDIENSRVTFDVYYKPMCTNIQVKKRSNHPESCKRGIIKGFADRNRRLCSAEKLENAQGKVKSIFVANGYSPKEVKEAMRERENAGDSQEGMTEGTICLTYVKGVSEQLRRIYNSFGIRAAFRCGKRIKSSGSKVKSQLRDRKNNVIYEIPCLCGAVYIGQTERAVGIRHQEHESDLRLTRTDLEADENERAERRIRSSRLVQHCVRGCGLTPDWDQVKVRGTDAGWTSRRLRETLLSMKRTHEGKEVINDTDVGIDLSWKKTLENFWDKK